MATADMMTQLTALIQGGMPPEQAVQYLRDAQAQQFAQMPVQQQLAANVGKYAGRVGQGLLRAAGVQDPLLAQASQMRELATQFDTSTAEGMMQYARALQKINPALAQQAIAKAQDMMQAEATTAKTVSERRRIEAVASREETEAGRKDQLRKALSELPEDATEGQLLNVYRKFGDEKGVEASITRTMNMKTQIEARAAEAKARAEAQLERDLQLARTKAEEAELRRAHDVRLEQMRIDARKDMAALVSALKSTAAQDKPMDDKAASQALAITTSQPVIDQGTALINRIYPKDGKPVEAFTLTQRGGAYVASLAGKSTETGKLQSDVQSFLSRARNAYLLAAKGTQTEGDAKRAMEQFFNTLDFTTADGVKKSIERVQEELRNQQLGASTYLTSRGFKPPEVKQTAPATKQDSVSVGGKTYSRPATFSDQQWEAYKRDIGVSK